MLVALSGPSCAGKSAVAAVLQQILGPRVVVIRQDDHFKPTCSDWDSPDAIDWVALEAEIARAREKAGPDAVLVVEGFLLLHSVEFARQFDRALWLHVDVATARKRRQQRNARLEAAPPDAAWLPEPIDYFDRVVWPRHVAQHTWRYGGSALDCGCAVAVLDASQPAETVAAAAVAALGLTP